MARKIIYVGKEHERAYRSICFLIQSKGLEGFGYRVEGGSICSDNIEYILSETEGHTAQQKKVGFGPTGATWFAALRGEAGEDENAVWMDFMNAVKKQYHKNYSVVEYKQQKKSREELAAASADAEKLLRQVVELFFPDVDMGTAYFRHIENDKTTEDVFGVAMRVELSADVTRGAPMPILCKVYFNRIADRVHPLPNSLATSIDRVISDIVPEEAAEENEPLSSGDTIDVALAAVERLVKSPKNDFANYICYSDPSDEEHLENLRRQMSHGHFELECKRVDLLYITHIKTECYVCDLYVDGAPALRIALGLNNRFSISCMNCKDSEFLVNRNEIVYRVNGEEKTAILDGDQESFGLSEEQIEEIRTYSGLAEHFKSISCKVPGMAGMCRRLRCASQTVHEGTRCADCRYPEVLYTDYDGRQYETATLAVAGDLLQVFPTDAEEPAVMYCSLCHRTVSSVGKKGTKCALCAAADSAGKNAAAKRLYKEYRGVLPLSVRLSSLTKPKRCFEDDEMILFALGEKRFAFNKLTVDARGYLNKAFRLK